MIQELSEVMFDPILIIPTVYGVTIVPDSDNGNSEELFRQCSTLSPLRPKSTQENTTMQRARWSAKT